MIRNGIPFKYAACAIAAPSISVQLALNCSINHSFFALSEINWSPLTTRPGNAWISGLTFWLHSIASSRSFSSASNAKVSTRGICPIRYPNPLASISCCTASVDTTISPMLISARREPAIPVFTIALIWNRSARIWLHIPAFTLPIPERTTTASFPPSLPW